MKNTILNVIGCILCLLIAQLSFSQPTSGSFPRKGEIDGQLVFILDSSQFYGVNDKLLELEECGEVRDSLKAQIGTYQTLVAVERQKGAKYEEELVIQNKIGAEKSKIIVEHEKKENGMERKIKVLKVMNRVMGGVLAVTAVVGATLYVLSR